jgi:hypothetical protein
MADKAKPQRLPKKYDKVDCDLATCPSCQKSMATRYVFQHLCDTNKEDGHLAKFTWEVPAYVGKSDKKPLKWKCPLCKGDDAVAPVLIKCGECGRIVKVTL